VSLCEHGAPRDMLGEAHAQPAQTTHARQCWKANKPENNPKLTLKAEAERRITMSNLRSPEPSLCVF
jgi:hypothetical protein